MRSDAFPYLDGFSIPAILKAGSWFTLALEFFTGRPHLVSTIPLPITVARLVLSPFLEYAFNIPMFQWDVLAAYVLFIDPVDLGALWRLISRHLLRHSEMPRDSAAPRSIADIPA